VSYYRETGVRLTPERSAALGRFLAAWPRPELVAHPRAYRAAVAAGLTPDDIRSACYDGLVRAAARFDPAAPDFARLARGSVGYRLLAAAGPRHEFRVTSGDAPYPDGTGDQWDAVSARLAPRPAPADVTDLRATLEAAIARLAPRQAQCVRALYLDYPGTETAAEIAAAVGLPAATLVGTARSGIIGLRKILSASGGAA